MEQVLHSFFMHQNKWVKKTDKVTSMALSSSTQLWMSSSVHMSSIYSWRPNSGSDGGVFVVNVFVGQHQSISCAAELSSW